MAITVKRMGVQKPTKEKILEVISNKLDDAINKRFTSISINLEDYLPKIEDYVPPRIFITPEAMVKMAALVYGFTTQEVAWHGTVLETKDDDPDETTIYLINDILVYPQTITGTTVDANEDEYPKWLLSQGEKINKIRMQGHSHVSMACFPSGTDNKYYSEMAQQIEDYYIFLIMNQKQEFFVRYYNKHQDVIVDGIPIEIWLMDQTSKEFFEAAKEIVKPKIHKPIATTYAYTPPNYDHPSNFGKKSEEDIESEDAYYERLSKLYGDY